MSDISIIEMEMMDSSKAIVPRNRTTPSDFVAVAKLRAKLEELVALDLVLRRDAATRILAVLENNIREGFLLIDIKNELRGEFDAYAEHNLPFSGRQARRLMQAAKNFQRDKENAQFLESVATPSLQYSYSEKPIIEQLRETGARHFQDLLVTSGLAPSKQISDPSQRITIAGFFKLARAIDAAVARLVRYQSEYPFGNWKEEDCEIIKRKMQPLVDFWKANLE